MPWQINTDESNDHFLHVDDGAGWYEARVRWDGCIHYHRYHNHPFGKAPEGMEHQALRDYLHICDIDAEIARLQELKTLAESYFDGWHDYPGKRIS